MVEYGPSREDVNGVLFGLSDLLDCLLDIVWRLKLVELEVLGSACVIDQLLLSRVLLEGELEDFKQRRVNSIRQRKELEIGSIEALQLQEAGAALVDTLIA